MITRALRTVLGHLVAAGVSVGMSLVAFEGILAIALPSQEAPAGESAEVVRESPPDTPVSPEDLQTVQPEPTPQNARGTVCRSAYYAVLEAGSTPVCARNPTLLMAHWGPPSSAWFRSLGGEFRVRPGDTEDGVLCTCLAGQEAYRPGTHLPGLRPVDHAVLGNGQTRIVKWVCGDPCISLKRGEAHE